MLAGMDERIERIESLFRNAGCAAQLCVQSLDGTREIALRADEVIAPGSVFKVCVALEAETRFADGRLDPRERVVLPVDGRVVGNIGFSLFADEVEVSLRDLVVAMLTISDNPATDALLDRVGIDAVNETCHRLGLRDTVLTSKLVPLLDSIWQEAGFAGWRDAMEAYERGLEPGRRAEVERRYREAPALKGPGSIRTTARDMAALMRLIWTDQAGPAAACARVRWIMAHQLTKNRLAAGFAPPAKVSAKSGGLVGVLRNEVGVVEYPGAGAYAMAVFTQSTSPGTDREINAAIGSAAALAVRTLIGAGSETPVA